MDSPLVVNILIAIALGIGAGAILRLVRNIVTGKQTAFWLFMSAASAGSYLVVSALGAPSDATWMKIFRALTVLLATNALLQLFNVLVWEYLVRQKRRVSVPRLVIDVLNFLVLAGVALGLLKTVFGVNLNAFLVTSTVVSAVVGLSLQDVLGSVVAGMALQMERPFNVGDWVKLAEEEDGQVIQMNWRTLTVRTRNNHAVILPNSTVTKQTITNYSRITPFMLRIGLGIAYRHPPGDVKRVLLQAVDESGVAREEPRPSVLILSFDDFSIEYEVRFWADDYGRKPQLQDAVRNRIWYSLKRSGIEIPFPIRDVTVRTLPEDFEERQISRTRMEIFRELRAVPLFEGLHDDQLQSISTTSSILRFAEGEHLVRQGELGDSMYIIKSGLVKVIVRAPSGEQSLVARIGTGGFFGEMSLLTGEPRSASIVAESETEVIMLTKADFSSIITSDASAVDALSRALAERMQALALKTAEAEAGAHQARTPQKADLMKRIRGFFGL